MWTRKSLSVSRGSRIIAWTSRSIHSQGPGDIPLLAIQDAEVYEFGSLTPTFKTPLNWTIRANGESWAVVGDGKAAVLDVLLGRLRIAPHHPNGIWPLLTSTNEDPYTTSSIGYASFAMRKQFPVVGGGFYDYSARYGGVRDEDKITLRSSLQDSTHGENQKTLEVEAIAKNLELDGFLDLPLIALSNGQTRRAHVAKELLKASKVLVLDEPLTGLDTHHRPLLLKILHELHIAGKPRVILGLRRHDSIPEWITHLAIVQDGQVHAGTKVDTMRIASLSDHELPRRDTTSKMFSERSSNINGKIIVEMKDINVAYHERKVLKNINWTIRSGERWTLQGANGSGKTTLLSLLTGDHPQSYIQPHLHLFSHPRSHPSNSTSILQQRIGFVSPEMFSAFPRRGMSVKDVVGTGFTGRYAYSKRTSEEDRRIDELLQRYGPDIWDGSIRGKHRNKTFPNEIFAALPGSEQSFVLFLRAIVSKAPLLILDEPFSGMTDRMIDAAKSYLSEELHEENQAVVLVTHWETEVPWSQSKVRMMRLEDGKGSEVL